MGTRNRRNLNEDTRTSIIEDFFEKQRHIQGQGRPWQVRGPM